MRVPIRCSVAAPLPHESEAESKHVPQSIPPGWLYNDGEEGSVKKVADAPGQRRAVNSLGDTSPQPIQQLQSPRPNTKIAGTVDVSSPADIYKFAAPCLSA